MLLDRYLVFDGGVSLTPVAITTSRASTDVIDMRNARDIGVGEQLSVALMTNGLFAAAGAATLTIEAQGSVDNSAWTTYAVSPALAIATLNSRVVGGQPYAMNLMWPVRTAGAARPRYLRLNYTVATGPFTAGAVLAFINLGLDQNEAYPKNFDTAFT